MLTYKSGRFTSIKGAMTYLGWVRNILSDQLYSRSEKIARINDYVRTMESETSVLNSIHERLMSHNDLDFGETFVKNGIHIDKE